MVKVEPREGGRGKEHPGLAESPVEREPAFGAAKLILAGEHAVLYGHPALVVALSRGLWARVYPGSGRISGAPLRVERRLGDGSPIATAVEVLCQALGARGAFDVYVSGDVSLGDGLGGSAAFCVAVGRAIGSVMAALTGDIEAAAVRAEHAFHGTSSGVDIAAALRRGAGVYRRATGWQAVHSPLSLALCVGFSGVSHRTRDHVLALRSRCESSPGAMRLVDELGQLSSEACRAFRAGAHLRLGRIMNDAQERLAALQLSCPEIDDLVSLARSAGAVGAKLTGAGGGGAVLAFGPESTAILQAWRHAGYDCFQIDINGQQTALGA